VFALYVITIAAAEIGLGLAIILLVFRNGRPRTSTLRALGELEHDRLVEKAAGGNRRFQGRPFENRRRRDERMGLLPAIPFLPPSRLLLGRGYRAWCPCGVRHRTALVLSLPIWWLARMAWWWKPPARLTPTGSFPITVGTLVDGLAAVVAVMVCAVALAVQVYSTRYMGDRRYSSYTAFVSLFTAAMLLVVLSADLIVLLVGWEVMGICSYFLIGHYWERDWAQSAAVKAFVMTKLGDVPFLFGIFVSADARSRSATCRRPDRRSARHAGHAAATRRWSENRRSSRCTAGCPTRWPVRRRSALIHAATMVAAACTGGSTRRSRWPRQRWRCQSDRSDHHGQLAVAAFAQDDMKRVLALDRQPLAYRAVGSRSARSARRYSTARPAPGSGPTRCARSPGSGGDAHHS
jgi:NADH-quinone oxidoreductase subunit L